MTWTTEDGKHEAWVAAFFGDGAISVGSGPEGLAVHAGGAAPIAIDEHRPAENAIGWVGACSCGWRSTPWVRVADLDDQDLTRHRAYGDYLYEGQLVFDESPREIEQAVHAEWQQHLEPALLLAEIADLTTQRRALDDRLAATVARARRAKLAWEDIGRAAGVTRQSAHEKWSRAAALTG
jgi:hypothetical protein